MKSGEKMGGVIALLGPTNTGKTTRAIERMLQWDSGVIGFPLRLLARENYENLCKKVGVNRVGLVTGEERIVPPYARYIVATVEAMPLQESFDFLGVDEIQMVADAHRGHVFTDRLLYHRGLRETVFIGSSSMSYLLERLIEDIKIFHFDRLSSLDEIGYQKTMALGRRTAVVAFSAKDVYQIGDTLRKNKGGVSVVMGSMSPQARKHQVDLYQSGEVDYLVATDAIGMGLNLTIDHIAFSSLYKFDGKKNRPLSVAEIGQIAGRAGRGEQDGTYGTTSGAMKNGTSFRSAREQIISPDFVRMIKDNTYPLIKKAYWRNPRLSFSSPKKLLQGLRVAPPSYHLSNTISVEDEQVLRAMMRSYAVQSLAKDVWAVKMLWDVCQIPDYEKQFFRKRISFLEELYCALHAYQGVLPSLWIEEKIKSLDKIEKNIYDITQSLGRVRTWAYIVHQAGWVEDAQKWQEYLIRLESELSQTLHQCLVDRFVSNPNGQQVVRENYHALKEELIFDSHQKTILLYGRTVAHMKGLSVEMAQAQSSFPRKYLYKWLQEKEESFLVAFWQETEKAAHTPKTNILSIDSNGWIRWREGVIGRCVSSPKAIKKENPFEVEAKVEWFTSASLKRLQQLLTSWVAALWQKDFSFLEDWSDHFVSLCEDKALQRVALAFLATLCQGGGLRLWQDLHAEEIEIIGQMRKFRYFRQRLKIVPSEAVYAAGTMTPSHIRWRELLGDCTTNAGSNRYAESTQSKAQFPTSKSLLLGEGAIIKYNDAKKETGRDTKLLYLGYKRVKGYAVRLDLLQRYRPFRNRKSMKEEELVSCFKGENRNFVEKFLKSDQWVRDEKQDWIRKDDKVLKKKKSKTKKSGMKNKKQESRKKLATNRNKN